MLRWISHHLNSTVLPDIISREITTDFMPLGNVMVRGEGLSLKCGCALSVSNLALAANTTISTIVQSIILHDIISDVPQVAIYPFELSLQSLLLNKYLLTLVFKCKPFLNFTLLF